MKLEVGDKVRVFDPFLLQLAALTGQESANKGWVKELCDDGDVMVEFPIGDDDPEKHSQVAPYPRDQVTKYDW